MTSEIEFKGELHAIPAGAGLVIKVDRPITKEQADRIREYARHALGDGHRILVVGPELTVVAVERTDGVPGTSNDQQENDHG